MTASAPARLREDLIHPDPLLDSLVEVCRLHGQGASRASLSAGLPLVDGRLTLDLAERVASRAPLPLRACTQLLRRARYEEIAQALVEEREAFARVLLSADVLQQSTATTSVTRRNGDLQVQDGPFAETKEALAGVFLIDVPDLDAAIGWAEKNPGAAWGFVEVRPVATAFVDGAWTG